MLYVAGARSAIAGFGESDSVEPLWIATAACAALALALDRRDDGAVIAGTMVGELANSIVWFESSGSATAAAVLANGATLTVALVLFRKIVGDHQGIERVRSALAWIAAAIAAAGAGAVINGIWLAGGPDALDDPLRWWLGDAVGLVTVAPLGLWVHHPLLRAVRGWAVVELGGLAALLLGFTVAAFATDVPLMYLSLPILGWLALRYGMRVGSVGATVIAIWSTVATGRGAGGFAVDGPDPIVQVQAYNAAVGLTAVLIGALATRVHREQAELEQAQRDREALERRLADVRAEERQRIAQRLHDDAIQVLVAADLQLTAAKRVIDHPGGDGLVALDVVGSRIHAAIDELRDAIGSLVPPEMHGNRLLAGLEAVADRHRTPDGPAITITARLGHRGLDNASGTVLYEIAREAMANAVVHGRPTAIEVRVTADGDDATLVVEDDGIGIADAGVLRSDPGHLGVRLMNERAMSVGGTVSLVRRAEGGTALTAVVPCAAGAAPSSPIR